MMWENTLLLLLSFICLPISSLITISSLLINYLKNAPPSDPSEPNTRHPHDHPHPPQTILITGISMTKGLTIARLLSKHTHHRIIAADIEPIPYTSPGRYTRAISKFHRLEDGGPKSEADKDKDKDSRGIYYINSLLRVIRSEKVNLWISCSGVVHEVHDAEIMELAREEAEAEAESQKGKKRQFQAIQLNADIVQRLHGKDTFIEYIQSLDLPVPESHLCTSAGQIESVLSTYQTRSEDENGADDKNLKDRKNKSQKKFILKPLGVNDAARAHFAQLDSASLLPLRTPAETRAYLSNQAIALAITPESPVLLQERIVGKEYCTHALVVRGRIRAFAACESSSMLMFYRALEEDSVLSVKMREFTERVVRDLADSLGEEGGELNGHLSFDFLVREGEEHVDDGGEIKLYPIECNPRAHTAVVLFSESAEMAGAYLSALDDDGAGSEVNSSKRPIVVPVPKSPVASAPPTYYWIGHDLVTLLILPFVELVDALCRDTLAQAMDLFKRLPAILLRVESPKRFPSSRTEACVRAARDKVYAFCEHVLHSTDGTYVAWDPVPFFVLYHVHWPARFVDCIVRGKKWSAVNVSTGKMFEC